MCEVSVGKSILLYKLSGQLTRDLNWQLLLCLVMPLLSYSAKTDLHCASTLTLLVL
jgi:hypothetical protein